MAAINPYSHTSFVMDPKHGRRLYADDVHDDLVGIPNLFTSTPTINKYAHSPEWKADLAKIPPLVVLGQTKDSGPDKSKSQGRRKPDNRTLNKRQLTAESLYELQGIPCPFRKAPGTETVNKRALSNDSIYEISALPCPFSTSKGTSKGGKERRKKRQFSDDSKYEINAIPDPFTKDRSSTYVIQPIKSDYASGVNNSGNVPSEYVFETYPVAYSSNEPPVEALLGALSSSHGRHRFSPVQCVDSSPTDQRFAYILPDSAYDYSPYSHNVRRAPMHSDYDYTSLAGQAIPYARQPTIFMQPPPMPLMPYQANAQLYQPYACPWFYYPQPQPPIYFTGQPYYASYQPYFSSSDYGSQADTGMENDDITNQFTGIPRGTKLRRPVTPNNETLNKNARGVDSLIDLQKLNVDFEPKGTESSSSQDSANPRRLRDFSVESIRDLNALPSFATMSMNQTPSKDVKTARSISELEVPRR